MRKISLFKSIFILLMAFTLMTCGVGHAYATSYAVPGNTEEAVLTKTQTNHAETPQPAPQPTTASRVPIFINPGDTIEEQTAALIEVMTPLIPKEIRILPDDKFVVLSREVADDLIVKSGLYVNLESNNIDYAVASAEDGQAIITVLDECTVWDVIKAELTITRKDEKGKVSTLAVFSIPIIGAISKATDIELLPEEGTKILLHSKTSRVSGYILEKNILDPKVTFQSLNPEIALVDKATGVITPVAVGKFTVKISGGGISKRLALEIVKSK